MAGRSDGVRTFVLAVMIASPLAAEDNATDTLEACLSAHDSMDAARADCTPLIVRDCLDSPDGATTVGMVGCFADSEANWDTLRRKLLERLVEVAKASDDFYTEQGEDGFAHGVESLTKAETAWETWRDLECISRADDNGNGSMRRIVAASCRLDLVRDRVLQHWFR